jgi:glyceraldehyde 3-phosphate dehydrogenase
MSIRAGINGFGRFGLHLLKYWLDRNNESNFSIHYINDSGLSLETAYDHIIHDKAVVFNKYKVKIEGSYLVFFEPNGGIHKIEYTNLPQEEIPWLGQPTYIFECSGKNTEKADCDIYLQGESKRVIISATSWDPEKTLVYGFNHHEYEKNQSIISYGSCTVNAYVPIASYLQQTYGIVDSDVNVIHNIQEYRLSENNTLIRKFCTLEKSGPNLLGFLDEHNFKVNYTVVPYTGVSILDFRFRLNDEVTVEKVTENLENAFAQGDLKHLYAFDEVDIGPEIHNCTTYSAVFNKENVKVVNNNLYLFGYFDNENSVNRYFDLAHYLASHE